MEFLLTYGWAILIVLVVISALAYYGVLDPTLLFPEKCVMQAGPLQCSDHNAFVFRSTNGQFHMKFQNVLDKPIVVSSMNISREDFKCEFSGTRTIRSGEQGCIPMFCTSIPQKNKKMGFQIEMKYAPAGGFDKVLYGELYTTLKTAHPYEAKGCPMPPGDGNGDGRVDEGDTLLMEKYMLSQSTEDVFDLSAYDLDNDGTVSGLDMNYINNLITQCGCCDNAYVLDLAKQIKEEEVDINTFYSTCKDDCGTTIFSGCVPVDYVDALRPYCRCCSSEEKAEIIRQINEDEITFDDAYGYCMTTCRQDRPACLQPS